MSRSRVACALAGGYTSVHQPTIKVDVCTSLLAPELNGPTQRAVATWDDLSPVTGNCPLCILPEDPHPSGTLHAESVMLHELGHALGLEHPNLLFADPEDPSPPPSGLTQTSYSGRIPSGWDTVVTDGSELTPEELALEIALMEEDEELIELLEEESLFEEAVPLSESEPTMEGQHPYFCPVAPPPSGS